MTTPASSSAAAGGAVPSDALAAALIALYANAEQQLLADLGQVAARDATAAARLLLQGEMRRAAQRIVNALALRSAPLVAELTRTAAERGDAAALAMLRRAVEGHPSLARLYLSGATGISGQALAAAAMIQTELGNELQATWRGILRFADDAYRAAVADAATAFTLAQRGLTPATAQHAAWRALTRQGVHGFQDSAGRRWNLASYVEMATRTAVQRAYNAAHQARMTAVGIDYFTVPHDGHPCPLCRPWEGAILSASRAGAIVAAAADDGRPVAFTVKATIDEARTAGLWHPNCRHTLAPYLPGVTKTTPAKPWTATDQAAYDATQRLRYLERAVRAAKREQLAALDEHARTRAAHRIRRLQGEIRDHIARTQLVRRRRREQINLGNR